MSSSPGPDDKKTHVRWMRQALRLAAGGEGLTRPNPPVGAVIVRNGRAIGAGRHERAGGPHAEINALADAGAKARGATLYVTLEPCCTRGRTGPCTAAILAAGLAEVVVGTRDPNPVHTGKGIRRLRRAGVKVVEGVCEAQARELVRPFAKRMTEGRPLLTLKMGMTLDGRIGDRLGRSKWITSEAARRRVGRMRTKTDVILVGRQTVCRDNPGLLSPGRNAPWRVIVDSRGRTPLGARVLNDAARARTLIATTARCPQAFRSACAARGVRVEILPARRGRVSLPALMRRLGELGALHVLCEGGGALAADLIADTLVDEYVFFVAPRLLGGGSSVPVVGGAGWPLKGMPSLRFLETKKIGDDLMIRAVPVV